MDKNTSVVLRMLLCGISAACSVLCALTLSNISEIFNSGELSGINRMDIIIWVILFSNMVLIIAQVASLFCQEKLSKEINQTLSIILVIFGGATLVVMSVLIYQTLGVDFSTSTIASAVSAASSTLLILVLLSLIACLASLSMAYYVGCKGWLPEAEKVEENSNNPVQDAETEELSKEIARLKGKLKMKSLEDEYLKLKAQLDEANTPSKKSKKTKEED